MRLGFWLFLLFIFGGIIYLYSRKNGSTKQYRIPAPKIAKPTPAPTNNTSSVVNPIPNTQPASVEQPFKTEHWTNKDFYRVQPPEHTPPQQSTSADQRFKVEHWTNKNYYGASQPTPDHDNWEGTFWDVQSPRNIEANLGIEYSDGAGSVTRREIRLMKYGPWEGGALLWAFCRLRQANRTFRTDRIISCTDIDTGEVIDDLENWLDDKYHQSPDRAIERIIESAWDALRILYYVSKADGRLTQKERAVVRDAVRSMSNHPSIDDTRIDNMFDSIEAPSMMSFKQAFGRLISKDRQTAEDVVRWSEAMIATDKSVSAAEQEAINYLRNRLVK